MSETATTLVTGGIVRARGRRWRILRVVPGTGCASVDLQGVEACGGARRTTLIVPFDRFVPEAASARVRVVSGRRWLQGLRAVSAMAAPADGLQHAAWARMALHPHQFEPALAVVRDGATRLLLADEVGLGKTIQAGLIISALAARGRARRALVLVPAGLRCQWADELRRRFGLDAEIVDAEALRRRVAGLPRAVNPWLVPGLFVSSLDYIKQAEVLHALRPIVWDVVVVDEAHAAAAEGTDRGSAVRLAAARARCVVLVTASPHAGSDEDFAALCRIGRHEGARDASPLLMFRRTRADVGLPTSRRVRLIRVRLHPAERALHVALTRYVRLVWHQAPVRHRAGSRLAMLVLSKRALSSAGSLAASIERRRALLAADPPAVVQLGLPLHSVLPDAELDDADDALGLAALGAPGLADGRQERIWLGRLLALAREAAVHESKLRVLHRLLSRTRDPVIVFTEYRDTLASLARSLAHIGPLGLLHGGLTPRDRQEALGAFTEGAVRILLATDAAGEGLNLHARCRWVVSLELPWSPRRLEQRVGRVDRIGQTRRVHALSLVASGTGESLILARLARKVDRMRQRVGGNADVLGITEEAALRAVVDGRLALPARRSGHGADPAVHLVARPDLREVAAAECERIAQVRRLGAGRTILAEKGSGGSSCGAPQIEAREAPGPLRLTAADLDRRRPWASVARTTGRPDPAVRVLHEALGFAPVRGSCVFLVRVVLDTGMSRELDESLHVIGAVVHPLSRLAGASDVRAAVEVCLRHVWAYVCRVSTRQLSSRADAVLARHAVRIRTALARERGVLRVLTGEGATRLQPSLFDRRAEREAGDRLASLAISLEESRRRCDDLERALGCERVHRVEPLLVLVGA